MKDDEAQQLSFFQPEIAMPPGPPWVCCVGCRAETAVTLFEAHLEYPIHPCPYQRHPSAYEKMMEDRGNAPAT